MIVMEKQISQKISDDNIVARVVGCREIRCR